MTRFLLEGRWSGYTGESRLVHRTVIGRNTANEISAQQLHSIFYTDGTRLDLDIRELMPRERVSEIHGYDTLIGDCLHHKVNRVDDLPKAK